jgi:hypothetical protein
VGFEAMRIEWTCDGESHVLHIDSAGRPTIEGAEPRPRRQRSGPARRGQSWSEEEETVIAAKLNTVDDAAAIAEELGRTRGAVLARAVKLGLLDASQVNLRFAGG